MRAVHWIACSLIVALMLAGGCQYARSQRTAPATEKADAQAPQIPSAQLVVPSLQNVPLTAYWGA